jgi:glycosyltransferase involved in cell wall biosynthesis
MACGAPVLALGRGGATETVVPPGGRREPTGLWFDDQSVEGLTEALSRFETMGGAFSPLAARRQAQRFNQRRFAEELFQTIEGVLRPAERPLRRAA